MSDRQRVLWGPGVQRGVVVNYDGSYESSFCWPLTSGSSSTETHGSKAAETKTWLLDSKCPTSVNPTKLSEIRAQCFHTHTVGVVRFVCMGRQGPPATSLPTNVHRKSHFLFLSYLLPAERICLWETFRLNCELRQGCVQHPDWTHLGQEMHKHTGRASQMHE